MAELHKTTIYIDAERVRQIKQLALDQGKTMSDLIREALDMLYGGETMRLSNNDKLRLADQYEEVADQYQADQNLSETLRAQVERVCRNTAKRLRVDAQER